MLLFSFIWHASLLSSNTVNIENFTLLFFFDDFFSQNLCELCLTLFYVMPAIFALCYHIEINKTFHFIFEC